GTAVPDGTGTGLTGPGGSADPASGFPAGGLPLARAGTGPCSVRGMLRPRALTPVPRDSSRASRDGERRGLGRGAPCAWSGGGYVVERVDLVQVAGVDQAHEQVADAGPVLGLVEQGILAVQDGLLQGPLAHIVVQRGTGLTQEQRQLLPVPQHVADGAAEGRI